MLNEKIRTFFFWVLVAVVGGLITIYISSLFDCDKPQIITIDGEQVVLKSLIFDINGKILDDLGAGDYIDSFHVVQDTNKRVVLAPKLLTFKTKLILKHDPEIECLSPITVYPSISTADNYLWFVDFNVSGHFGDISNIKYRLNLFLDETILQSISRHQSMRIPVPVPLLILLILPPIFLIGFIIIYRSGKEIPFIKKRRNLKFNQRIGVWVDTISQNSYCPNCWPKLTPMQVNDGLYSCPKCQRSFYDDDIRKKSEPFSDLPEWKPDIYGGL